MKTDMEKTISGLKEIADYFHECRGNASFGSKAEEHFWELQSAANDARELLEKQVPKPPTIGGWISVKDRMPAETHSIFFRFYGTNKWNKSMWREQSDKVLVTVAFKDSTKIVTTGETHDGIWNTTISRTLEPVVTHWAEMPEPPKEGEVE